MSDRKALLLKRSAKLALAILAVAVAARLDLPIPGSPVPQSAQTLAVLLAGFGLGARNAVMALLAYLVLGAAGLPVFADGASGLRHLVGPTSGYLAGFVIAAGMVGWFAQHHSFRRLPLAILVMMAGHSVILGLGWLRLGATLGYGTALTQGVTPFLLGGVLKSILAALIAVGYVLSRSRPDSTRA
jgi:biotin transport system substrate-specific component